MPSFAICTRDHPRVGGEKMERWWAHWHLLGSPPRGRGKEMIDTTKAVELGITPAWAGKSRPFAAWRPPVRDHPRVGGEKTMASLFDGIGGGSPPRGRGKVLQNHHFLLRPGITPAWAGKSCPHGQPTVSAWDHPRVGGEKTKSPSSQAITLGSPPRGRGKAGDPLRDSRSGRITPAWAGKSCSRRTQR